MDDNDKPFSMPDNYYDPPEDDICAMCEADHYVKQIKIAIHNELEYAGVNEETIKKLEKENGYSDTMDSIFVMVKCAVEDNQNGSGLCEDHKP